MLLHELEIGWLSNILLRMSETQELTVAQQFS